MGPNIVTAVAARLIDIFLTLLYWAWFTLGFILFFSWGYLFAFFFSADRERSFQKLNSSFYTIFFKLVKITAPSHQIEIDSDVLNIHSSVIVCNHLSYLDPLLLISSYDRQKTIVKPRFFSMPIFGWIIKQSGYIPGTAEGRHGATMLRQMEKLQQFFGEGGNLFVFPEGTRSRTGELGPLNKGTFKVARLYQAPIYVLHISNTNHLFTPGNFFFKTRVKNRIRVKIIDCIDSKYYSTKPSIAQLEQRVRQAYTENRHESSTDLNARCGTSHHP